MRKAESPAKSDTYPITKGTDRDKTQSNKHTATVATIRMMIQVTPSSDTVCDQWHPSPGTPALGVTLCAS